MIDNKAVDIALLKDQIEVMRSRLIAMTQDRDDCLKLAKMNFTKSEETESLRQQLASRDAEIAKLKDDNEYLYIAAIERDQLREQVTLLREVMNRIAFSRVGTCENIALELFNREAWAIEALAATEEKP